MKSKSQHIPLNPPSPRPERSVYESIWPLSYLGPLKIFQSFTGLRLGDSPLATMKTGRKTRGLYRCSVFLIPPPSGNLTCLLILTELFLLKKPNLKPKQALKQTIGDKCTISPSLLLLTKLEIRWRNAVWGGGRALRCFYAIRMKNLPPTPHPRFYSLGVIYKERQALQRTGIVGTPAKINKSNIFMVVS